MLKWTRHIFLFLLLGAIVNVAVAWGCALRTVRDTNYYMHNPWHENPLVLSVTRRPGFELVSGVQRSGTMLSRHADEVMIYDGMPWWPTEATPVSTDVAYAVAAGWPMLTLRAWRTTEQKSLSGDEGVKYTAAYHRCAHLDLATLGFRASELDDESFPVHVMLPLKPIWRGAVGNTLVYAAAIALLALGCARLRRGFRSSRGLCPACAYPRGSSPVCTECGAPLPC